MTRGARIGIGVGIGVAVLLAVAFITVLNKRWWARRIMLKWNRNNDTGDISANAELLKNTPLAELVRWYRDGQQGWTLRTATPATAIVDAAVGGSKSRARGTHGTPLVN